MPNDLASRPSSLIVFIGASLLAFAAACGSGPSHGGAGGLGGGTSANTGGATSTGGVSGGAGKPGQDGTGGGATGGRAATAGQGGGGVKTGGGASGGDTSGGDTSGGRGGQSSPQGNGGRGGLGGAPSSAVGVTREDTSKITSAGLTVISYGGYLNGESFQQDGLTSYGGHQYAAFWNTARHVVVARRELPAGAWAAVELADYTNKADDAHNTISLGISPGDGTLHLAFDHHGDELNYRRSVEGLLDPAANVAWTAASFTAVSNALVGKTAIAQVTYPRFLTEPGGKRMLFGARLGASGAGDEALWEWDATTHAWTSLGKYIDGISDDLNAYLHGLAYTPGGNRLHASWCWRETPDATTNHDLLYVYSDDHGRTWKDDKGNALATTGSRFITKNSAAAKVWTIGQNRGLINQEHMTVDADGVVHVLLSHMPDAQADDSDFTRARTKSEYFHYWRSTTGVWKRSALRAKVVENLRGKLVISSTRNVYAVLPDLRIAGASAARSWDDWAVLDSVDSGKYFSDPLVDAARLLMENRLTVFAPRRQSRDIDALTFRLQ